MNKVPVPMTGRDLEKYVPEKKIVLFEELKGKKLEHFMPDDPDYLIILFEVRSDNEGHWVSLLRYGRTLEFFDSYGKTPKEIYDFNSAQQNNILDQNKNYLSIMIKDFLTRNKKYKFLVNKKQFQKDGDGIATCGRWSIFRIKALMKKGMTLHEFYEFYKKTKNLFKNESNDELVSLIVG